MGALLCAAWPWEVTAQRGGKFMGSSDHPAIAYGTTPLNNAVDDLNRRLQEGSVSLAFGGRSGYLKSALEALNLPVDSQMLVFDKLSLQGRLISPSNPRALFFNDRTALGWVRDGDLLEIATHDEKAGVVFYTLEQKPTERPVFKREFRCLGCHMVGDTLGVPGLMVFTTIPASSDPEHVEVMDHRSPFSERWGDWFVTGNSGSAQHLGNRAPVLADRSRTALPSVEGLFDPEGFQGTSSDVAALLTFSHQTQMVNLLTRASWEARANDPSLVRETDPGQLKLFGTMMDAVADEVVDYMLFVDEAPLPNPVTGQSGFSERWSKGGPRDRKGRSLYELDLKQRLLKYPCSYLIYSPAFDALPAQVKTPIYKRMWAILSGAVDEPRYRALALADRQAVVEILKDTKPDLPSYFTTVTQ
jgi:hypothetical protein